MELEWRDVNARNGWLHGAVKYTASSGSVDLLQSVNTIWMGCHEEATDIGDSNLTMELMDAAAENGQLTMLQWLQDQHHSSTSVQQVGDGRIESKAMDNAAAKGYLDVVEWLHANHYQGGCSKDAMNNAAENGHLNVVQWLHVN